MIRTKALAAALSLLVVAVMVAFIFGNGSTKPEARPEGTPFPAFSLPRSNQGAPPFTQADFNHDAVIVNIFASWCGPCRAEHPLLIKLKEMMPIIGINYMDDPEKLEKYLRTLGNPYRDIVVDQKGYMDNLLGIDSIPRTMVVVNGAIVYAHQGILKQQEIDEHLMPVLKRYRKRVSS
jgi:cytochrome c biogenesis protein CcmG/thiol:disulfide interchange protein DsbE